jgi:hypothetical protein
LDTYLDALEDFPEDADHLKTKAGSLVLIKTDIFKGLLYYVYENNDKMRGTILSVSTSRAKEVKAMNKKGIIPDELGAELASTQIPVNPDDENADHGYEDVTGLIELKNDPKKKKKKPQRRDDNRGGNRPENRTPQQGSQQNRQGEGDAKPTPPQNKQQSGNQQRGPQNQPQNRPPKGPRPEQDQIKKDTTSDNGSTNNTAGQNQQPKVDGAENRPPNPNKKKKFFNKNRKPKDGQGQ